jgi:hypothetical protein
MLPQNNWIEWFSNHPGNEEGNMSMAAFGSILGAGIPKEEKLRLSLKEIDTVILATNANNKIMILHSPKNFGGTRSRPDNKVICMLGVSVHPMYVQINLRTSLTDCQIMAPAVRSIERK